MSGGAEAGSLLHLVGDVGGTNARMGLVRSEDGALVAPPTTLQNRDFTSLETLVRSYLAANAPAGDVSAWAIAVAGPVSDGRACLTNLGWEVSEEAMRHAGLPSGVFVNDYEALALAAARVRPGDVETVGPRGLEARRGPIAVLGPGTGFGAAALAVDGRGSAVLVTEGGHIGFAPTDEVEIEILRRLVARFGRVSIERVLSGPGLMNLHQALLEIGGGGGAPCASPAEVLAKALEGESLSRAAVERFCRILGGVAGDFALAYGAVGGVLLAGGIAPRMVDILNGGGFREAFEAKGRFVGYVSAIPTQVVVNPYFALLGAAARLGRAA